MIKAAAREQLPVAHPENTGIRGITIAELTGPTTNPDTAGKNAVIVLNWRARLE